jgi:hypothetical protein
MMNDYYQNSADAYDFTGGGGDFAPDGMDSHDPVPGGALRGRPSQEVDFEDPKIASLPKILLMGPRRGGKTSIQVSLLLNVNIWLD